MTQAKHVTLKDWMEPIEETEKFFDLWAVSDTETEVNIGLMTNGIADECGDFEVVRVRESPMSDEVIEIRVKMDAETAEKIIKKHKSKYRTVMISTSQCNCVQMLERLAEQNTSQQGFDLTQIMEQGD